MTEKRRFTSPITVALATVVLGATLYVGARPVAGAPALGPLLEPANGVWAMARAASPATQQELRIPNLSADVDVRVDDRGVPHVFAASVADAARAVGYLHARDRLFQMELTTRSVAGTLAELVGDRALPLDREARAQGLADAARRLHAGLRPDAEARAVAEAYADGVNAYITGMSAADLPFEYRLLGARPQRWEPEYTAYLYARMGLMLAYSDGELRRAAVEALVGRAATDALFPVHHPLQEPIQPNGLRAPRMDRRVIPPPAPGDTARAAIALAQHDMRAAFAAALGGIVDAGRVARADPIGDGAAPITDRDDVTVGSNNWAVGPRRAAAGHALLAGDPHLAMTLPAIWYEVHLVVPGDFDVYGVSIPGAPIPPIGFNRDVAWSVTNTAADVADYFVETVDDSLSPRRYLVDGTWRDLRERVEAIRGKNGRVLATDTIRESHRGPLVRNGSGWVSRRWTVTDGYDTMSPFLGIVRSTSVRDLWAASDAFYTPPQNFVSADRGGHIAIRSTGRFPVRARGSDRGDMLLDGARSANDWQSWWLPREYPQAYDPPQGFVASANQQPKDPRSDPRYLGWDWPSPWRAMRINEMLRTDSAVTPDKMRRMQTDPVSAQTVHFLPRFIAAAQGAAERDTVLAAAARHLAEWDGRLDGDNRQAVLFDAALTELTARTWDELTIPAGEGRTRRVDTPQSSILLELMDTPDSPWWDDQTTPNVRERRDDILRASVAAAWQRVVARLGPPGPAWRWGASRHALIRHLIGIPALSRRNVPVVGGPGSVSPSFGEGNHGASWRMVVELGPEVRAWGIYPGGQSGNPMNRRYDEFIGRWSAGTLDSLRFPRRADELRADVTSSRITFRAAP